jgi:glutathione synthase
VRVGPDADDLDRCLSEATASGPALLQEYVPDAPAGDVRVHVVGGALLEVDGAAAVVRRVPGQGEWRSNVALGGVPTAESASGPLRRLVQRVGPTLVRHGLWHVGLDVVGDRIVECNVFSPGGLGDIERFTGVDFCAPLVRRFVATCEAS